MWSSTNSSTFVITTTPAPSGMTWRRPSLISGMKPCGSAPTNAGCSDGSRSFNATQGRVLRTFELIRILLAKIELGEYIADPRYEGRVSGQAITVQ